MADQKISQLTGATTPLAGTEVLPIVQSGVTKKVAVSDLTAGRPVSATEVTATTGNFIVGTAGKGVDFSSDPSSPGMTSELLDDYEEGTWTPTDASGAGLTFATAAGWYTKVGRLVVATFRVVYPATANASASTIGGLPFTSGSGGSQQHQGSGLRYTDSNLVFSLANSGGSTEFTPFLYSGAAIANSSFSSKIIDGMVVYQTA